MPQVVLSPEEANALRLLTKLALGDTHQCKHVADFLLAWWNAGENGGFDFTDLWSVDAEISEAMLAVIVLITNEKYYIDAYGYGDTMREIHAKWRPSTMHDKKAHQRVI